MNQKTTSFTLSRPLLLMAVLLSVAAITAFILVASPLRDRIVSENVEIQKSHAKSENDQRKVSRLPEFQEQSAVIADNASLLRLLLPEEKVVDLIKDVEGVSRQVGGKVTISKGSGLGDLAKPVSGATKDQSEIPGSGLFKTMPEGKTLGLTVTFSGTYTAAVEFLHKVETMPYFLDVLSIDIRPSEPSDEPVRTDMFSASDQSSGPVVRSGSVAGVRAVFEIVVYLG
ncbi:MAG: hypothetical protein HGA38_04720 [Candidatus Moranbacteria bacterium]|nr:hypothetical protein [Candidatus Moranbacteria bacterium]NTW46311.1 hypothetical protein [Candidatus Moranbacteria bacterium]